MHVSQYNISKKFIPYYAVKAIALAGAAGQKILTITSENLDLALTEVTLPSDTETEIRNSVNAGMIVTAHEQSINFNGWVGEGYIIIDPATGAGAYKIAGGGNGAFIVFAMFAAIIIGALLSGGAIGLFAAAWAGVGFYSWVKGMGDAQNPQEFNENNLVAVLSLLIGLTGIAAFGAKGVAILVFAEAMAFFLGVI